MKWIKEFSKYQEKNNKAHKKIGGFDICLFITKNAAYVGLLSPAFTLRMEGNTFFDNNKASPMLDYDSLEEKWEG